MSVVQSQISAIRSLFTQSTITSLMAFYYDCHVNLPQAKSLFICKTLTGTRDQSEEAKRRKTIGKRKKY